MFTSRPVTGFALAKAIAKLQDSSGAYAISHPPRRQ